MIKRLFSWLDPFFLFGYKEELENLVKTPLQLDETLRLDKNGSFHRLKVPTNQANLWNKLIFWTHIHFNKKSHLTAIDQLIFLFEQRILALPCLVHTEFQKVSEQIECLKSLKNDYGFSVLGEGDPVEIDQKLQRIEKHANLLLEKYMKQTALEEEEKKRKIFLHFFKEAQAILTLLSQESWFGLQEARRLLVAFSEDIPFLFAARLHNIQTRLLLTQDLNEEIDAIDSDFQYKNVIPDINIYVNGLRHKLNREVNNLEEEIEVLIENLRGYYYYHPYDQTLHEYFLLIGINPFKEENVFSFDSEQPLNDKISLIQTHLNQLAA